MTPHRIGILGSGAVAKALAAGFIAEGHTVMLGSREPQKLAEWAAGHEILGEVTIVVGGAPARVPVDLTDPGAADDVAELVEQVRVLVAGGVRLKEAVAQVAGRSGVLKRGLYDAVVKAG